MTAAAIIAAHRASTIARVREHAVLLAVQDTTTFNFTLNRKTPGMGPIGQAGLSGFCLHSCLAVSTTGVPLGLLGAEQWARERESKDSHRPHKQRPLDDKESARWLRVMEAAMADLPATTRVVMVADRESDILDLFIRYPRGTDRARSPDPGGMEPPPDGAGRLFVTHSRKAAGSGDGHHYGTPSRVATLTVRTPRGSP